MIGFQRKSKDHPFLGILNYLNSEKNNMISVGFEPAESSRKVWMISSGDSPLRHQVVGHDRIQLDYNVFRTNVNVIYFTINGKLVLSR